MIDQLNSYKASYGACVANLYAIQDWKKKAEATPVPRDRPDQLP